MNTDKMDQEMSLPEHLGELKKRLILLGVIFIAAFAVCYVYSSDFISVVVHINPNYRFVQSDVTEMLAQQIKVAMIAALILESPAILWQINGFVSPGLTRSEGRKFLAVLIGGLVLFVIGAAFCYTIVIPFTLRFFLSLNTIDSVQSLINLKSYISYIVAMLVAFGCIFEMPVIAALLSGIGLLKPRVMASARQYLIVVFFVLGAAITPPDVISQCMVAIPMILLYEFSILICKVMYRARRKRLIAQGIDPDEEENASAKAKKKESRWERAKAQVEQADAQKKDKDKK